VVTRRLTVAFDARDAAGVAAFWAQLLGRGVVREADSVLVAGAEAELDLRFVAHPAAKVGPNRMHVHLTSLDPAGQQRTVATALGLGASHVDVGQRPEEGHVVLADPDGNELCVIEPGNAYLAGCGFFGELACDGTRAVGLFWSEALGWPLVWDQGEETAIQSPQGGTKVSWGGPPVAPLEATNRQRFEVTVGDGDQHAEVDRLVSLGATLLGRARARRGEDGAVVLVDPDGNGFSVRGG
jgi:catechol 2,3-dioxygenase-like lactoylglutathione lyase family enzyme/predicted enzyme related to lactoylglutathione lyase